MDSHAQVFRKMVEVVHHCHELGVMHRDLKPENFLLTSKGPDGELKLTGAQQRYTTRLVPVAVPLRLAVIVRVNARP